MANIINSTGNQLYNYALGAAQFARRYPMTVTIGTLCAVTSTLVLISDSMQPLPADTIFKSKTTYMTAGIVGLATTTGLATLTFFGLERNSLI